MKETDCVVLDTETTGMTITDRVIQYASITVPNSFKKLRDTLTKAGPEDFKAVMEAMGIDAYRARTESDFFLNLPCTNMYFRSDVVCNPFALAVHGITPEYLEKYATDVCTNVHSYLPPTGSILIGHNVKTFDFRMLTQHLSKEEQEEYQYSFVDTLKLVKHIEKIQKGKFGTENYKLLTLVLYFMPEYKEFFSVETHNAMSDCEMTLLLLMHLARSYPFVTTISGLAEELA